MSALDEILKSERLKNEKGWIEYAILKLWECPEVWEVIADCASEELAELRDCVTDLENRCKEAIRVTSEEIKPLRLNENEKEISLNGKIEGIKLVLSYIKEVSRR